MLQSCEICGSRFGRVQELKRHLKDRHEPPRQCPFCDFEWARPDKIKHHITMHHSDQFTAEAMAVFQDLHGRNVVAFLDDLYHGPGVETAHDPSPPQDPSPS